VDAFGAEPFILWFDYELGSSRRRWYHNFQVFYYPLVYCGYWIANVLDVGRLDLQQRSVRDCGAMGTSENQYLAGKRKYAMLNFALFVSTDIIAPIYNNNNNGATTGTRMMLYLLAMSASWSFTLMLLFSLSHQFEGTVHDPTETARGATGESVCWYKSQVETSSTYGGRISGYLTGGLNFQIEHHLFPRMNSAWYPYIAPAVRRVCEKHGVNYTYFPTIVHNVVSAWRQLYVVGTGSNHHKKKTK
jgi:fatty acid desaturase